MSHPFSAPELRAGNPGVILGFCLPLSALRLLSAESFWATHKTQLLDLLCGPAVAACGTGQAQGLVRAEICPSPPSGRFRPGFPALQGLPAGSLSARSLPAAWGPSSACHCVLGPLSPRAALLPWASGRLCVAPAPWRTPLRHLPALVRGLTCRSLVGWTDTWPLLFLCHEFSHF